MIADFLLINRMKKGDDKAFDIFVQMYYEEILKYCTYHCFDKNYAEDLTQEVFLIFFTKLSEYHSRGKTLNYLYTIARNLCKNFCKKKKERPLEEIYSEEIQKDIEKITVQITVETAIDTLSYELKEVVILYYFQGHKISEIAKTLNISIPLVKYRLREARKQLKKILGEEDLYGF